MSRKSYPALGEVQKLKGQGVRCACCGAPAVFRIDVQVNWFRGDDEVYHVCAIHKPHWLKANWNQFFSLIAEQTAKQGGHDGRRS